MVLAFGTLSAWYPIRAGLVSGRYVFATERSRCPRSGSSPRLSARRSILPLRPLKLSLNSAVRATVTRLRANLWNLSACSCITDWSHFSRTCRTGVSCISTATMLLLSLEERKPEGSENEISTSSSTPLRNVSRDSNPTTRKPLRARTAIAPAVEAASAPTSTADAALAPK